MTRAADTATVSSRIIEVLLESAGVVGLDRGRLLAAAGIAEAELAGPDARVPLAREQALWEAAVEQSGDPFFGLNAGRRPALREWDLLGYAIQASSTVREAFGQLVRYNRLVHDVAVFALEEDRGDGDGAGVARLTHRFRGPLLGACRPAAEFTLAAIVVQTRLLTAASLPLREVAFQHAHPGAGADATYANVFQAPVRFGQPVNALVLEPEALALPLRTADPQLLPILQRHGDTLLDALPKVGGWTDRLRGVLLEGLPEGEPSLTEAARRLRLSPRTLQRRLAGEDTTLKEVLDELRQGLARRYVAQPDLSLGEAAFLLGFSEPAAFRRAFRRWTGVSPSAFRRQVQGGA